MGDNQTEIEDETPSLQDYDTRIVSNQMSISNDSERAELGTKCKCHVLRDIEEKCREMKTLGLTKDVRELLYLSENEKIKEFCSKHVKHCKECTDADANRISDETNAPICFYHCCTLGPRKASEFWVACSCVKSYLLTSMGMEISQRKLLIKLIISATNKRVVEKSDMLEAHEFQAGIEEVHDEEHPKEQIDKAASISLCCSLNHHSEPLQIEAQDIVLGVSDNFQVNFPHPTKRRTEDFSQEAPESFNITLRKYTSQFATSADKKSRFLKNINNKSRTRSQNYGVSNMGKFLNAQLRGYGKKVASIVRSV